MEIKDPADILKMTDQQLAEAFVDARQKQEDWKAQEVAISDLLKERLAKKKLEGMIAGHWAINKVKMITFRTTVEEAEKFGATEMSKKVNTKILRKLYDAGKKIPGANQIEYLKVTEIEK